MELLHEPKAHLKVARANYLGGKRIRDGSAFDRIDGSEAAAVLDMSPQGPGQVVQELLCAGNLSERTGLDRTGPTQVFI
jgi:hypothetical protein